MPQRARTAVKPDGDVGLLERASHVATLQNALAMVEKGLGGRVVLLAGEAGVGKTALVQDFRGRIAPAGRVLWGSCDPLFTPRALGPFIDIAQSESDGELRDLVAGGKPHQVAEAMSGRFRDRPGTVLVLEDMHWADEATLDVLSLLGRRIDSIPALVVITYRDDELGRAHPLTLLLGELRDPRSIQRLAVEPLTSEAVDLLAAPYGVDAEALYRATSGNPFFVTEALAAGSADDIPTTVREAVLARAARLPDVAGALLEAVAVAPPQLELWLLDAVVSDAAGPLEECLGSGMLEVVPGGVAFRHELARLAVEQAQSPYRRLSLHRAVLDALQSPATGELDLARVAHHADAAGDTAAVLRFAPAAAERAAANGAHREAAAQYARALRFADGVSADQRADLLERRSYECYLTDQSEDSVRALELALACRRELGDQFGEGEALASLSRRLWCSGRIREAWVFGWESLRLLETLPPGRELALACSNLSQLAMNSDMFDETVTWATRALELAETVDVPTAVIQSHNNIGTVHLLAALPDGLQNLERSLALAERVGPDEEIGRAYVNLAWAMTRTRGYDLAPWLERGIDSCADRGLERWGLYILSYRARFHLDTGRWDEAARDAAAVLRSARYGPLPRVLALSVLGLVRARRGDPEQWGPLDEAVELVRDHDELQYLAPLACARAEAAWLDGIADPDIDAALGQALDLAVQRHAPWVLGEVAWLRRLTGATDAVPEVIEPYASQLRGESAMAAAGWDRLGCPYDAALSMVLDDDEDVLRRAHAEFQRLGARPAAAVVARRLRERGVRQVPRGPRTQTQQHPAGLTRRESEILSLMAQGLSNAEIAARLYLSERTVHHHVSAVLRKLDVTTRGQASAAARRHGLLA